jgi:peptidoglycan-N-acetylglucosamine deacetylase
LDILATHGVSATFFLIGSRAEAQPLLVRRILAEGHDIGNHSWSHPNLAQCSRKRIREELINTNDTLEQITGKRVRYFRPPHGAWRPRVNQIARSLGLRTVIWNAMIGDWMEAVADVVVDRLSEKINRVSASRSAVNIVLHDGGHVEEEANRSASVEAAGLLAARYKESHRFVKLDGWDKLNGRVTDIVS